jgi:predicted P-loop ATPase
MTSDTWNGAAYEHVKASIADVEFEVAATIKGGDPLAAYGKEFIAKCSLMSENDLFETGEKLKKGLKGFKVKEWKRRISNERRSFTPRAEPKEAWRRALILNQDGTPKSQLSNAITALRCAPEWQGVLAYNEFASRAVKLKKSPAGDCGMWRDVDDVIAADWLQHEGIGVNPKIVAEAVQCVAYDRCFHPVREYLHALKWDGESRVQGWMSTYLGVERNEYSVAVGAKWLIAAISRIMKPGSKVDTCLILEGVQGIRKSSGLSVLGGDEWYTDQISDISGGKEPSQDLAGKWIIEFSDLAPMSRGDTRALKSFVSRRIDHYRPSYGRRTDDFPRHCVFAATTNETTYLQDDTGGRRWWPVYCNEIDLAALQQDRDQLWAEAYALWQDGRKWWLEDRKIIKLAQSEQNARFEEDPWDEMVWNYVKTQEGNWPSVDEQRAAFEEKREFGPFYTSTEDILTNCIKKKTDVWTKSDQMRVGSILRHHGMKRVLTRSGEMRVRRYFMPTES